MSRRIKTTYLDVAAYVLMKGLDCEIKRLGELSCIFFFKEPEAEKLISGFLKGNVMLNIQKYLFVRTTLKTRIKRMPILLDKNGIGNEEEYLISSKCGQSYYYLDNGVVQHSVFGRDPVHIDRLKKGNMYSTRQQAEAKIIKTK